MCKERNMKLINLVENVSGAPGCQSAHGLSVYVKTRRHRILMDTGPGPVLADNARALGVDLSQVDTVVLSHGHYDHADGLPTFAGLNPHAPIYIHRGAEWERFSLDPNGYRYNGMSPAAKNLSNLVWTQGRVDLDEELTLFDGADPKRLWPQSNRKLFCRRDGQMVQDPFDHEQYLVVREGEKSVLLSGCAHKGILNILDRYEQLFGGVPDAVLSGFHMMKRSGEYLPEEQNLIRETACQLSKLPTRFYTCHCTGLPAFQWMKEIMAEQLHYLRCGETLEL